VGATAAAAALAFAGRAAALAFAGRAEAAAPLASRVLEVSWFFLEVGLFSFGGAYAVLPYIREGAVATYAWFSDRQMIDALALGETTPRTAQRSSRTCSAACSPEGRPPRPARRSGAVAEPQPRRARERREPFVRPRPVPPDGRGTGAAHDEPEHEHREDGVVGVTEDGDEIRDEVERHRHVGEEQPEGDPGAARQFAIDGEVPEEPQRVGQEAQGGRARRSAATSPSQVAASATARATRIRTAIGSLCADRVPAGSPRRPPS
jgi:hypothetical protein